MFGCLFPVFHRIAADLWIWITFPQAALFNRNMSPCVVSLLVSCADLVVAFDVLRVRPCCSLFVAGSETTAKALSWAIYFLAKNPEMHSRCREEALRVAPLRYDI